MNADSQGMRLLPRRMNDTEMAGAGQDKKLGGIPRNGDEASCSSVSEESRSDSGVVARAQR